MLRVVSACLIALAFLPAPAAAEWHFVPMIGVAFKGATNINDTEIAADKAHMQLGGSISLLGDGIVGVEAFSTWIPGFFEEGNQELVESSRAATLMGNLVLTTPKKWTEYGLRPYVSGGFGLVHATNTQFPRFGIEPLPPARVNSGGYNLGVGAIGFFSERTGVRFDFRYHSTLRRNFDGTAFKSDTAYLRYTTLSVGVVFRRR